MADKERTENYIELLRQRFHLNRILNKAADWEISEDNSKSAPAFYSNLTEEAVELCPDYSGNIENIRDNLEWIEQHKEKIHDESGLTAGSVLIKKRRSKKLEQSASGTFLTFGKILLPATAVILFFVAFIFSIYYTGKSVRLVSFNVENISNNTGQSSDTMLSWKKGNNFLYLPVPDYVGVLDLTMNKPGLLQLKENNPDSKEYLYVEPENSDPAVLKFYSDGTLMKINPVRSKMYFFGKSHGQISLRINGLDVRVKGTRVFIDPSDKNKSVNLMVTEGYISIIGRGFLQEMKAGEKITLGQGRLLSKVISMNRSEWDMVNKIHRTVSKIAGNRMNESLRTLRNPPAGFVPSPVIRTPLPGLNINNSVSNTKNSKYLTKPDKALLYKQLKNLVDDWQMPAYLKITMFNGRLYEGQLANVDENHVVLIKDNQSSELNLADVVTLTVQNP